MKNHMFFAIWAPSQASQSQNGEDVSSGIRGQEFSSRIQRIHYFPADPAEMVSGAAVQTLPNHAQESQDDVSSQANSLKPPTVWDICGGIRCRISVQPGGGLNHVQSRKK